MDMRSVLAASFPVPTTDPAWQQELLLQLDPGETMHAEPRDPQPTSWSPAPPIFWPAQRSA